MARSERTNGDGTHTFQMHLYWDEHLKEFELYSSSSLGTIYTVYVGPVEVTAPVPATFDVRSAKLAAIKAQETKLRAEFQARLTELQRQASELLALEMSPAKS